MSEDRTEYKATIERFSGFSDCYDRFRPTPPRAIADMLTLMLQQEQPDLVVDLGSGTGLSTRIWRDRAARTIGIEPSSDMRQFAASLERSDSITYQDGLSAQTGLPDNCADIVTCSQSLHWMEPESTFREVGRILRRGGIFAAYDCDWPTVTSSWEADAAYMELMDRCDAIEQGRGLLNDVPRWEKPAHMQRMMESGIFRYTREIVLQICEEGTAERLVGLALSQGCIETLLKQGCTETDLGVETFRQQCRLLLGDEPKPWYFCYRVRLGIV